MTDTPSRARATSSAFIFTPQRPASITSGSATGDLLAAFVGDELFDTWYPRLVRLARGVLGNADEAEDVAQEAFVRLASLPGERPRSPSAWLLAVARNLAFDRYRAHAAEDRMRVAVSREALMRAPSGEDTIVAAERVAAVRRALRALPARDRTLLLLHHDNVPYRAIAQRLAIALGSVGSLLARAHRRFLAQYELLQDGEEREAVTGGQGGQGAEFRPGIQSQNVGQRDMER